MMKRVEIADMALSNLVHGKENLQYFSKENYINLRRLVNVIDKIRKYLAEISQLKGYEIDIYRSLVSKFESIVQLLELNLKEPFANFLPHTNGKQCYFHFTVS